MSTVSKVFLYSLVAGILSALSACDDSDAESMSSQTSLAQASSHRSAQARSGGSRLLATNASCANDSLVTVVAHMDDDLLFVDPAISTAARRGACVTTVFVIGGSSDSGFDYVSARERASMAAYARMAGVTSNWASSILTAGENNLKRVTLVSRPNLSLVFMRMPGGHVRTGNVPLADVFDQIKPSIQSWSYTDVESGARNTYTRENLIVTTKYLVEGFGATKVLALNPDNIPYVEHPDHIYSARLVREALRSLSRDLPITYYDTYPTAAYPANVSPTDTQFKRDLLGTYFLTEIGDFDGTFSEHISNGNWIAKSYGRTSHAWANVPTYNPEFAPIVNIGTHHCLTSGGLGQTVYLSGCNMGWANQQWKYINSSTATGGWGTAQIVGSRGNCLALRNGAVQEASCNNKDLAQFWQPWDFGKIFAMAGNCMLQSGSSMVAGNCSAKFPETAFWSRKITTVDDDKNLEVALVGDVVGDGVDRVINIHRRGDGPGFNAWVSGIKADALEFYPEKWYDGPVGFGQYALNPTCGDSSLCYDQSRFLVADFNGDGKADLMTVAPHQGGTAFWLLKSTGSHFSAPVLWASVSNVYLYDLAQQYLVGDFNGDRLPDVLIAHTRGDRGLNFWVMTNTGSSSLSGPIQWVEATNLQKNAQLFVAKLSTQGRDDVVAIDEASGVVRISSFSSTGSNFRIANDAQGMPLFVPFESRMLVAQGSAASLSDVWVIHSRADGTAFNIWQLKNSGNGMFGGPALRGTISDLSWRNIRPYQYQANGVYQMLFAHRMDTSVGEYNWGSGNLGLSAVTLGDTSIGGHLIKYGSTPTFQWMNMAWRARLN